MFRRTVKRVLGAALVMILLSALYICWIAFPIASGYGAKVMCSSIFVSGRSEHDIKSQDLDFVPLNHASCKVNYQDSSVTCSMFGFAAKKAIYRQGLGATVVNELSEKDIRSQHFNLPVSRPAGLDTIPWPMGDQLRASFPEGIDSLQVAAAVDQVFNRKADSYTNITRALIVLYKGRIVAERYAPGITAQTRLPGWSMAKSITSALVGILVNQHRLDIDRPAPVPEWANPNDKRHAITVRNLLHQASGLEFDEVYERPSHANRMLFLKANTAGYAAAQRLIHPPGTDFRYSSGNTNIMSRICRQVTGDSNYHTFPYAQLFFKLGMYNTMLEPDASGTFVGSSFCFATARDWARFGLFYLNNGVSNGEQILPPDWVRISTTPSRDAQKGGYGFQWWLNAGEKNNTTNRLYPGLPAEMYFADGYEGQNIFIIPSKKLVVVRLGLTRNRYWGEHDFLTSVIAAVRSEGGLSEPGF